MPPAAAHQCPPPARARARRHGKKSVRNLRIREDTAKYLRNLDVDSAYYDPKTRTMRGNPSTTSNSVTIPEPTTRSFGTP